MSSYEDLFEASVLEVIAPPPSLEFPEDYTGERAAEWISRMRSPTGDRKAAFFDENLDFFLTIRFPSPPDDPPRPDATPSPPPHLLSFLAHLQISYETSYISPSSNSPDLGGSSSRLSMPPPRNSSMQRNRPGSLLVGAANASMFPPHTPHPIPSAAESDLKYVQSQGTPLVSAIWGESDKRDNEAFALLWDAAENGWLAIYKMTILVLYMITKVPDPLLCITVSTTLRHKPLAMTAPRKALAALIDASGGLKSAADVTSPVKSNGFAQDDHASDSDESEILSGLQEINLLDGLAKGPTFSDAKKRLSLPTTRLGANTRMHEFSLGPPPSSASPETAVPYSSGVTSPPPGGNLPRSATLRKSFRKTLKTHMGFRVRMRTVFVPYFLLPQKSQNGKVQKSKHDANGNESDPDSELEDDILEEREQREAGNEEHTVVLSVEVENLFSGGASSYHFEVERVDVSISGTGARASFIDWSANGGDVFPLQVGPREQVNLLYAVSFLRGPEVDEFSLARPQGPDKKGVAEELQRAVAIHLMVKPIEQNDGTTSCPTHPFPSRWNCVLDLASSSITQQRKQDPNDAEDEENHEYFVLPTPASPFPTAPLAPPTRSLTPLTTRSVIPLTAVAGSKRHTIAAFDTPTNEYARMPKSPMNYQSSTSMLNPNNQPPHPPNSSPTPTGLSSGQTLHIPNRASYMPPSVAFQSSFPRSPTTYDPPTSPPLPLPPMNPLASFTHAHTDSASTINEMLEPPTPRTPRTPAYPAYPNSPGPVPPTPFWQTPIAQQSGPGTVGPSVEIRRERGGSVPQTPGPTVGGFAAFTNLNPMNALQQHASENAAAVGVMAPEAGGEPIVVSVGLLPSPQRAAVPGQKGGKAHVHHTGEVYPLDQFTLDIFVFNQSSWTRRFEVSYPDERRRRRKAKKENGEVRPPGIIPLENRVRVGPLLPSTCQSVRMDFLALAPGVHSIDVLTLTDVQSGLSMHLRNVIDIIVREPEGVSS
ncbi:TRAPP trafficking subunit Trs65-domain-containing protein [Earliella scabrosa]|nr:TRAPP trafficking subunit Trs65-domain-containing protein [Earliella scabrosa]